MTWDGGEGLGSWTLKNEHLFAVFVKLQSYCWIILWSFAKIAQKNAALIEIKVNSAVWNLQSVYSRLIGSDGFENSLGLTSMQDYRPTKVEGSLQLWKRILKN